jgi:hypothetical protein
MKTEELIQENNRRKAVFNTVYDPATGEGCCGKRTAVEVAGERLMLPEAMVDDAEFSTQMLPEKLRDLRFRYDFEYWALLTQTVVDKVTRCEVPFRANRPQRLIIGELEEQRTGKGRIDIIILKARQWGCSTLIQLYFAWIQIILHRNYNSIVCAHNLTASNYLASIFMHAVECYPTELQDGDNKLKLARLRGCSSIMRIPSRNCNYTCASSNTQNSARGQNLSLAHLSELASWSATQRHCPDDVMRTIGGSMSTSKGCAVVMESTANGRGNYFFNEWTRATGGDSSMKPVFIPWYMSEFYFAPLDENSVQEFYDSFSPYELRLWNEFGCTLEQIHWYRLKFKQYSAAYLMRSEFPSDADEAFEDTQVAAFEQSTITRQMPNIKAPELIGDLRGKCDTGADSLLDLSFEEQNGGLLKVWSKPDTLSPHIPDRYVTAVDVGGTTERSDYSVISVVDAYSPLGQLEVVAQWRGHIDHDLLAWKSAQIAKWYCGSLLVFERNSFDGSEGDSEYILNEIGNDYNNLYRRGTTPSGAIDNRPGFHTNRKTKPELVNCLRQLLRDGRFIEHDSDSLAEMSAYEVKPGGRYGARRGMHDDILMSRAIALFVSYYSSTDYCKRYAKADKPDPALAPKEVDKYHSLPRLCRGDDRYLD